MATRRSSTNTADSTDSSTASSEVDNIMPPTAAPAGAASVGDMNMNVSDADQESNSNIPVAKAKTITFADEDNRDASSVESDYSGDNEHGARNDSFTPEPVQPATSFKYKAVSVDEPTGDANSSKSNNGLRQRPPKLGQQLGFVSKMYDFDNKGYLNEEERQMREMDVEGKGYLTKEQVYDIVQQKLEEEYDVKQYKQLTCWMFGLMVLLTICGFGTSYTSAILSKEINADSENAAVLVKNTGTVVGFDAISDTIEFAPLSDAEYSERRLAVLEEMSMDDLADEHAHRKLANKKSGYSVLFDQGKISERDLESIVIKCNAGNVVNIERTWKNADGTRDTDYDTICGPEFTVVNKKAPKKKGGGKMKVRTTTQQVVFKKGPRKNKDGDGDMLSFVCSKGTCYGSGSILQQSEGHPCSIQRGHEECHDGLLCYAGESITYGTGVCTKFAKNRKPGQFCDISYGLQACQDSSMCEGNLKSGTVFIEEPSGKVVGMGTCSSTMSSRASFGEMCDASFGSNACANGLVCYDVKGKNIEGSKGTGICGQKVVRQPNYKGARWYVEYNFGPAGESKCVRDCPIGKFNNCGGNAQYHDEFYESWDDCCKKMLWWINTQNCVSEWPVIE